LAQRVLDRARKGLYRNYIAQEEELAFVRGRIDPVATMLNISRGVPRLPCSYEEHTADIDDNRIPFWTLHQVRRQALRHQKVRRELDSARRALAGTIALEQRTASDCIERGYHRLNDDYVPMHGLCRFILEQSGPGIRGGDRTFIPFYLNMPGLFEKFVAEWLRQNRPSGVIVRAQHSALLDANFRFEIRTDIFLIDEKTGRHLAVLDTKYKSGEQPTEDDIHQLAFYANELQVDRAMLIYPSPSARQFRIRHGNRITLESLVFDVTAPLEQAGVKFLTELSHRLHLAE
jgi:5-methylcytosine-specific restriction enzyme subunit McrC